MKDRSSLSSLLFVGFLVLGFQGRGYAAEVALTSSGAAHANPQWSPDGNWIAYDRWNGAQYKMYKVSSGGGSEMGIDYDDTIGNNPEYTEPQWSPDGTHFAFVDGNGTSVWKVPTTGGPTIPVYYGGTCSSPQWSPSGTSIVCAVWSTYYAIGCSDLSSGSPVTSILAGGVDYSVLYSTPEWSPDGQWVVYARLVKLPSIGKSQIYKASSNGDKVEHALTSDNYEHTAPQWTSDGKWIVYQKTDATGVPQIYKVPSNGGAEVALTSAAYNHEKPQCMPGGNWIAYQRQTAAGRYQIYRVPIWGGTEVAVTSNSYSHYKPQWSADGRWIAYEEIDATGFSQIYKVSSGLTQPSPTPTPSPSPTAVPTPVTGWSKEDSDSPICGLLVYGDKVNRDMAGLPGLSVPATTLVLGHFASNSQWYTGVVLANPDPTITAHVTLNAYSSAGGLLGTANRNVPAKSKLSELVPALFPGVTGTGWIEVTSDKDIFAFDLYGDQVAGGVAALPACELSDRLVLPHFVVSTRWWTGVTVLNPGASSTTVTLTAYRSDGTSIQSQAFGVAAKSKLVGYVETLLPLTANQQGWIDATSSGGNIAGLVLYGDKTASPNRIAASIGTTPATTQRFSNFYSDAQWWTGIAIVNAKLSTSANVTLTAYAPNGVQIDQANILLPARNKTVGTVSDLFGLGANTQGWVEASSDQPIVGFELLNADDAAEQAWGLAAIESQGVAYKIFMAHYISSIKWWSLFGIANPSESVTANITMTSFLNGGGTAATDTFTIGPKARVAGRVENHLIDMP